MIDPGLDGKVVMVTGANNPYGIGAAVAKAFAEQGAKIFLHYFRQKQLDFRTGASVPVFPSADFYHLQQSMNADEVLAMIRGFGVQTCALEADLSEPTSIPALFDMAEESLGSVEVLVNNAAYWEADTFLPTTAELENKLVELWTNRPTTVGLNGFDRVFAVIIIPGRLL